MNWIREIRNGLKELDLSKRNLRKFGAMVGGVFVVLALLHFICGVIGILLIIFGIVFPEALKGIYKGWMGIAFTLGWLVSGILLILLFFFVLTPIGLIARLAGKEFLDIKPKEEQNTYWIKTNNKKIIYDKMY